MKSLYELVAPYDSVSLIGMCKNAGKTTTLNQLIAELKRNGVSFGATSVGRDGESTDLVTNTVKPGIFVYKGTIVATAAQYRAKSAHPITRNALPDLPDKTTPFIENRALIKGEKPLKIHL